MAFKPFSLPVYLLVFSAISLSGCNSSDSSIDSNGTEETPQNNVPNDDANNNDESENDDDTDSNDGDSTDPGSEDPTDPGTYTIGGTASLLSDDPIRIYMRYQGDPVPYQIILAESGEFRFSNVPIPDGRTYELYLDPSNPETTQCSLLNTEGSIQGSDIDDVDLLCIPEIKAHALNQSQFVELHWTNVDDYSDLTTELCKTNAALSVEFDDCAVEGNLLLNPDQTLTIDPAINNANYWFELAVRSDDHILTKTVTARPESPTAPTSQSITKATGLPESIALWKDTAVSAVGSSILFNNGTEHGGWTYNFPGFEIESNYLVTKGDTLYFVMRPESTGTINNQTHYPRELWRTDGTPDGTFRIYKASTSNTQFRNITASEDYVVFVVNSDLYVVDETVEENHKRISSVNANNIGAGFQGVNSVPLMAVDDGVIFTGYLNTEGSNETRLLKLTNDQNIEEVHGAYSYESFISIVGLYDKELYFTARTSVSDPGGDQITNVLWRVKDGESEALFNPGIPATSEEGFREVLSPLLTRTGHVYFYTQPWDEATGKYIEDWRLAYYDGTTTELIWDEALLGQGWDNSSNDSAALQFRRSAAVGSSYVFLAPTRAQGNIGTGRMWVVYDPATESFEQLSVAGELRFGRSANLVIQAEEKSSGTWLIHGYNTNPPVPYEIIHLTEDDSNTFILETNGLNINSLVTTTGERLWFRTPLLHRVLAADD